MLERLSDYPQLVWCAAVAFYVVDVARLVEPGQVLLGERRSLRLRPVLARMPFEFRGGELYIVGLLQPWRGLLASRWAGADAPGAAHISLFDERRAALLPLRIASSLVLISICAAGPILTALFGLAMALLLVVPFVYAANIVAGVFVLRCGDAIGLTRSQAGWLMLDALLCAPYGANWPKRVVRKWPEVDAASLAERFGGDDVHEFREIVAARRRETVEEQG